MSWGRQQPKVEERMRGAVGPGARAFGSRAASLIDTQSRRYLYSAEPASRMPAGAA